MVPISCTYVKHSSSQIKVYKKPILSKNALHKSGKSVKHDNELISGSMSKHLSYRRKIVIHIFSHFIGKTILYKKKQHFFFAAP